MVAAATTALDEPAKESEPSGVAETSESLNPEAPQKAAKSTVEAQTTHVEEPAFHVEPLQAVPLNEGCKDLETTSTQLIEEGTKAKPKKQAIQASFCFVFFFCVVFFFLFIIAIPPLFFNIGIIVMRFTK